MCVCYSHQCQIQHIGHAKVINIYLDSSIPSPHYRGGCCHKLMLWRWTRDVSLTWIMSGEIHTQTIHLEVWALPVISFPGHFQSNSSLWYSCGEGIRQSVFGAVESLVLDIAGRSWCSIARNSLYKFVGHSYKLAKSLSIYMKYFLVLFSYFLCYDGHSKCKWSVIYPAPFAWTSNKLSGSLQMEL